MPQKRPIAGAAPRITFQSSRNQLGIEEQMTSPKHPSSPYEKELAAIGAVLKALGDLEASSRQFVLRTVIERLGIKGVQVPSEGGGSGGVGGATAASGLPAGDLTKVLPKDFLKSKKPRTDVQRVACLAYYLAHARNQPAFKTRDITKLDTEAAGGGFTHGGAAVRNATIQNHFLASAGAGKKQITPHGEDVVRALPNEEGVKKVIADYVPPRRYRRRRKKRSRKP
jgi:hypothetical protein